MAIQRLLSATTKNQLQLVALLMKGNQRLVLQLFLTFRVLWNPLREFWIATTLKLLKNFLRLWGIFLPNLRILSQKNNKLMPFILFLAMTVTTNTLEDQTSAWYTFERTSKSSFLLQKRNSALLEHTYLNNHTIGGIILKLSLLISVTTSAFVWKPGILTPPALL